MIETAKTILERKLLVLRGAVKQRDEAIASLYAEIATHQNELWQMRESINSIERALLVI